jgi:hypothetical protein
MGRGIITDREIRSPYVISAEKPEGKRLLTGQV